MFRFFWITFKGFSAVENVFSCSLFKVSQNETLNFSTDSFPRTLASEIFSLISSVATDPVAMLCSSLFESALNAKGFSNCLIVETRSETNFSLSATVLDESSFSSELL